MENQWFDATIPVCGHVDHIISIYMVICNHSLYAYLFTYKFIDYKIMVKFTRLEISLALGLVCSVKICSFGSK